MTVVDDRTVAGAIAQVQRFGSSWNMADAEDAHNAEQWANYLDSLLAEAWQTGGPGLALPLLAEAGLIRRRLLIADRYNLQRANALIDCLQRLAEGQSRIERYDLGSRTLSEAVMVAGGMASKYQGEKGTAERLAEVSLAFGQTLAGAGEAEAAAAMLQDALDWSDSLEPARRAEIAATLGYLHVKTGQWDAALGHLRSALDDADRAIWRGDFICGTALLRQDEEQEQITRIVRNAAADAEGRLASIDDLDTREGVHAQTTALFERLHGMCPGGKYSHSYWVSLTSQGNYALRIGDAEDALRWFQRAVEITEQLHPAQIPDEQIERMRAMCTDHMVPALKQLGRTGEAQAHAQEALKRFRSLARRHPEDPRYRRDVFVALSNLADLQLASGDADAAFDSLQEALDSARQVQQMEPGNPNRPRDVIAIASRLGEVGVSLGRYDVARSAYAVAVAAGAFAHANGWSDNWVDQQVRAAMAEAFRLSSVAGSLT